MRLCEGRTRDKDKMGLWLFSESQFTCLGPSRPAPESTVSVVLQHWDFRAVNKKQQRHSLLTFKQISSGNLTGSISRNVPLKRPSKLQLTVKATVWKRNRFLGNADSAPQHQLDSGVLKPVSVSCMFVSDVILRSEIPQIQQRYSGDHSGKACDLIWLGRSPSERSSPSPDTVVYENLVLIKADRLQMSVKATYLRGSIKTNVEMFTTGPDLC